MCPWWTSLSQGFSFWHPSPHLSEAQRASNALGATNAMCTLLLSNCTLFMLLTPCLDTCEYNFGSLENVSESQLYFYEIREE